MFNAYSVEVDSTKGVDLLIPALKILSQDVAAFPMFEYLIVHAQHVDLKTPIERATFAADLVPWEWEWIR